VTAETLPDDPPETVVVLGIRDPRALLAGCDLFRGLPDSLIDETAGELEWISLPAGTRLYSSGEPADGAYLLLSGCLATLDARNRPVQRIECGETFGELVLLGDAPRRETVAALRDSELVRIPREAFERAFLRHPDGLLRIARLAVERAERAREGPREAAAPRVITLVPVSDGVDVAGFAAQFVDALSTAGRTELVWSVRGRAHSSQWFHNVESRNDFVVYAAERGNPSWSRLCVRQADAVLLLARADEPPSGWRLPADAPHAHAPAEVVLLHGPRRLEGAATASLAEHPGLTVHHVLGAEDTARVARLVTGRAVGIVLSGGGARGFAHIGVVRALRESGIPIDLIGGTSMGALMAAGVALGWDHGEMRERFRRSFVDENPLGDYTLPVVSLVSGGRVLRLLRREFGEVRIEDLRVPFFCVSTDLTGGTLATHRVGPLWRWLRASIAIPGVLPPVTHRGRVYVDGGAMNNLPVDVLRAMGRGPVIGVDVGADEAFTASLEELEAPRPWELRRWLDDRHQRTGILRILWRAGMVNSTATTVAQREQSDLLLRPALGPIDLLDWKSFDRAIDLGYRHTLESLSSAPPHLFA